MGADVGKFGPSGREVLPEAGEVQPFVIRWAKLTEGGIGQDIEVSITPVLDGIDIPERLATCGWIWDKKDKDQEQYQNEKARAFHPQIDGRLGLIPDGNR